MKTLEFTAEKSERLDVYLTDKLDKTRSAIKKLSDDGYITVNGVKEKAGKTLKIGDEEKARDIQERFGYILDTPTTANDIRGAASKRIAEPRRFSI